MEEGFLIKAENWWKNNVLNFPEKTTRKVAKLRVKVKRKPHEHTSEKERKATIKVLNGPFGRMDRRHDDTD